jgi:flagellar protein FlaG
MAGTSISEMIFFIAAIMVSSAVAVTLIGVIDRYTDEISEEASVLEGEMRSRLTIINDPLFVEYDTSDGNLTFYLKNTGTGDLSVQDIVVSANGTTRAGSDLWATLLGNSSIWKPGDVVEVTFRVPNLNEAHDYNGWASTSGITEKGIVRGSAQTTILFRIRSV